MKRMPRRSLAALLILSAALAGCASASKTYTATGAEGHSLNCSGTMRHWGMCLERAGEICGARGYTVLERNGEPVASVVASGGELYASASSKRTMLIACK